MKSEDLQKMRANGYRQGLDEVMNRKGVVMSDESQRYYIGAPTFDDDAPLEEADDGALVLYDDHAARVAALEADVSRLREDDELWSKSGLTNTVRDNMALKAERDTLQRELAEVKLRRLETIAMSDQLQRENARLREALTATLDELREYHREDTPPVLASYAEMLARDALAPDGKERP